ncbi:hypothetical protein CTI12_AA310610 [Artemisia annua]|uniref:Uncharacterized protein n=1 Tax=Artemisia annua TaxID=35608 RepID=A0A2U1MZ52_ARTAN|nr:hypothetical protein CTI12_AA310610 [Artemisia annua]
MLRELDIFVLKGPNGSLVRIDGDYDITVYLKVDLSTFKARLEQLNIFVWKEVNGSLVRIHGGDYELTILLKHMGRSRVVDGTVAFEDVIRMLEKNLELSLGCYKLTFKHPNRSIWNVWLKTDRDWHFVVSLAKCHCTPLFAAP